MVSVYVHIPFCRRKCIYCDFFSVGERLADWGAYTEALCRELDARENERYKKFPSAPGSSGDTIYIGGGTPSLMPEREFRRLASRLLQFAENPVEFTIEVNPDDVTEEKARMWKSAGVNRVSMGVQSLIDSELKFIGRRHTAAQAVEAYRILRQHFSNISLDVMFGLPGQTPATLRQTLERIIAMNPEHLSAYSLMYEERTALTRMRDSGSIVETDDTDTEKMFQMVSGMLGDAGYCQYEISNYYRRENGGPSEHNSRYWRGYPYIGIGPGAHSYDGERLRRANNPDINAYIKYWGGNFREKEIETDVPWNVEILTDEELREEYIMTRLRTREGISLTDYSQRFGVRAAHELKKKGESWVKSNHLKLENADANEIPNHSTLKKLSLTKRGILISDEIMVSLF